MEHLLKQASEHQHQQEGLKGLLKAVKDHLRNFSEEAATLSSQNSRDT